MTAKKISLIIAGVMVLSITVVLAVIAARAENQEASLALRLSSDDQSVRFETAQGILDEREELVKELCEIVHHTNADRHPAKARATAAYLLAIVRAPEAVPALSSALGDRIMPEHRTRIVPFQADAYEALIQIGRPAIPQMIDNLRLSDNVEVRGYSTVVLHEVLGAPAKERLLELIHRLLEREEDPKAKERLTNAREIAEQLQPGPAETLY
jgi:hypothetical protein